MPISIQASAARKPAALSGGRLLVGASGSSAGAAVYPVEVDGTTFDLMERFGGLDDPPEGGLSESENCSKPHPRILSFFWFWADG
jgi:hypothetical protein